MSAPVLSQLESDPNRDEPEETIEMPARAPFQEKRIGSSGNLLRKLEHSRSPSSEHISLTGANE